MPDYDAILTYPEMTPTQACQNIEDDLKVDAEIEHYAILIKSASSTAAIMGGEFLEDADVKDEFYKNVALLEKGNGMPQYPVCLTWIPTRLCNLKCEYCGAKKSKVVEAGPENFIDFAEEILAAFPQIQFWCLLGGDLTVWGDRLFDIVKFFADRRIFFGITSNSVWINMDRAKKLMDCGLSNWTVSLDTLYDKGGSRDKKRDAALSAIAIFRELGLKDLHCTTTVMKDTVEDVPYLVKYLTSLGVWTAIQPFIFGKSVYYDYSPTDILTISQFCFTPSDLPRLNKMIDSIEEMRGSGALIHTMPQYLKTWPRYAVKQNWKCRAPWNLVVDADGSLKPCLQLSGKRTREYTVWDLKTPGFWNNFLDDWLVDQAEQCQGCYWDCQREPEMIWDVKPDLKLIEKYFRHGGNSVAKIFEE
jgi:MoaA/NifB/PqqE/SkfB family radical SAM enzyme